MIGYITRAPIRKRDGRMVPFDMDKIRSAVFRCCLHGVRHPVDLCERISRDVTQLLNNILDPMRVYTVEEIQDHVEQVLMGAGENATARTYILYRAERAKQRDEFDIDPEEQARVKENRQYFRDPIAEFQFYSKYARWDESEGRRETWEECVDRVVEFLQGEFGDILTDAEWVEGRQMILTQQALPSMRLIQMAGPAARRCNISIYNCAYSPIESPKDFSEILYILMQGTGCGFSVEEKYVRQFPIVQAQCGLQGIPYVIPDSTIGWCDALKFGITSWILGEDVAFDYSQIRPQGARLLTKGGRASGPEPLKQLLEFARTRILARQGACLTTEDCHDIACMCGFIVQVGGVRRAAMISLSDLHDVRIRDAKNGQFWITAPQRAMSNNSAVHLKKPTSADLMRELLAIHDSGTGERGIFNRGSAREQIPDRRQLMDFGVNPCGEIWLRPRGLCNLSIAVARPFDTASDLERKVKWATIWGTLQSGLTNFQYLSEDWKKNAEEERLLGVDITGQMDCYLLMLGGKNRGELLNSLRKLAIKTNVQIADRMGIRPSVAVTCVKPAGNSAQLLGCSSGIHARYAQYYIRRVRAGAYDPLSKLLREAGVPCHPEVGNVSLESASVWVFEFPIKSPPHSKTRHDMDALDQLYNWLLWKTEYTEHNPSATIYVGTGEWITVAAWLETNWSQVGGLSFLPKEDSEHVYVLAPYEEISVEEYNKRTSVFPEIPWWKLRRYEKEDTTDRALDYACTSGSCEI